MGLIFINFINLFWHLDGMENKTLGLTLIGLAAVLIFSVYILTQNVITLEFELHKVCPLPAEACPHGRVPAESYVGFGAAGGLVLLGGYLILTAKKEKKLALREKETVKKAIRTLKGDEKKIFDLVAEAGGLIFQNELVEKSGLSKVKVTRILDKLESRNLVERRRRGMANVVVLKH